MEESINPDVPSTFTHGVINSLQQMQMHSVIDLTAQWEDTTCTLCGCRGHRSPNCRRRSHTGEDKLSAASLMYFEASKLKEQLELARKYGILQGASDTQMADLFALIIKMKADKDQKRAQYLAKSKMYAPQYGPGGSTF